MPKIIIGPSFLEAKCQDVTRMNSRTRKAIAQLKKVFAQTAADNIGLSINQIGYPLNIIIVSDYAKKDTEILINPRITQASLSTIESDEGCLSFPMVSRIVKRYTAITVDYLDEQMNPCHKTFQGHKATAIQHEIDHLHQIKI